MTDWRFFKPREFDCHDGTQVPGAMLPNVDKLVREVLEPLRDRWGGPLIVVSGWRHPDYNRKVGGARLSQHLTGRAADIRPVDIHGVADLHQLALTMYKAGELPALGGLGSYSGWIHVDTHRAPDGHLRRWGGRGLGSEVVAETEDPTVPNWMPV